MLQRIENPRRNASISTTTWSKVLKTSRCAPSLVDVLSIQEKLMAERSDAGSQPVELDYQVHIMIDVEYDKISAEDYFDNGDG